MDSSLKAKSGAELRKRIMESPLPGCAPLTMTARKNRSTSLLKRQTRNWRRNCIHAVSSQKTHEAASSMRKRGVIIPARWRAGTASSTRTTASSASCSRRCPPHFSGRTDGMQSVDQRVRQRSVPLHQITAAPSGTRNTWSASKFRFALPDPRFI